MNRSPVQSTLRSGAQTQVWSSVSPRAWCSSKRLAADVEVEPGPVGLVGIPVLGRPERLGGAELALVDDPVVPGGLDVPLEARGDRLVRDDPRRGPAVLVGFGLVELDAEAVVDVAVREHRGVEPVRPSRRAAVSCTFSQRNGLLVSTTTSPSSVPNADAFANAATNAVVGEISARSPNWLNGWWSAGSSAPVNSRSAVSRTVRSCARVTVSASSATKTAAGRPAARSGDRPAGS